MIHNALRLVALPWQNTQNLTFFINLILLHGALLFSFEAGTNHTIEKKYKIRNNNFENLLLGKLLIAIIVLK